MSAEANPVASSAAIEHLRWALTAQVGPILFGRIIERFGSAQQALGVGVHQLESVEGVGSATAETIVRSRDSVEIAPEIERAEQLGVRIICRDDDEYPPGLRHIPDPPICLYLRGRLEAEDAVAVAIVGARRCSLYGREQAHRFAYQLATRGVTIISGLARGVDSEGHKGAIAAGGRTLAVLGNGLADIYPPENRELAERICRQGAVISELPLRIEPRAENFLPRNRLIAGMSLGVLVVEAAWRSGSLSTAARASEYNREVFAIPGRLDNAQSNGPNALIRDQHAKLVMNADDILDELGEVGKALQSGTAAKTDNAQEEPQLRAVLNEDERRIIDSLDHEETAFETIAESSGLPTAKVAATLIALQLKGLVRQLPGNVFIRLNTGRKK
ncbi:MAG: DNA-protecting protein DprA [Phycisphaerales bacterium]|nr:DNA-protecting protein DprA [Phycisphaerales bacterium]